MKERWLAGKEPGKDVGQFGSSTQAAAGTIRCVNDNDLIIRSVVDLSLDPLSTTFRKHRLAYPLLLTAKSFSFRPNVTIVRL
jgi:hypothetical protein